MVISIYFPCSDSYQNRKTPLNSAQKWSSTFYLLNSVKELQKSKNSI